MKFFSSPSRIILFVSGLLLVGCGALLSTWYYEIGPFGHDKLNVSDNSSTQQMHNPMLYVPDYPGAQQVQVWTEPDPGPYYSAHEPYKRVTFVTPDTPQQVFTFYKDELRGRLTEDWRVDQSPTEQSGDTLRIIGFGRQKVSAPMFIFTVRVGVQEGDRARHVTVERSYSPGM